MSAQTHHGASGLKPVAWAREASRADLRLPGILLFLLSAQFMTAIMLGASIAPGYDFNGAAISDLGVIGETALLFNASLVAVGVLTLAGGYLFYRWHSRIWLLALFGLAGIGAAGAGAVPLNTSDLHSLFALIAFVCFNLMAVGCAAVLPGPMKVISIVAGGIGLVFVVLMVIGDGGNPDAFGVIGHGGTERMIVYPVMLWMMALGGYLMASPRDETSRR
jgi:hypothetical membrane protein